MSNEDRSSCSTLSTTRSTFVVDNVSDTALVNLELFERGAIPARIV